MINTKVFINKYNMEVRSFKSMEDGVRIFSDDSNKHELFDYMVARIEDAINEKLDFFNLFVYEKDELVHMLFTMDYKPGLKKALEFYESKEEYTKCAKVTRLISLVDVVFRSIK